MRVIAICAVEVGSYPCNELFFHIRTLSLVHEECVRKMEDAETPNFSAHMP